VDNKQAMQDSKLERLYKNVKRQDSEEEGLEREQKRQDSSRRVWTASRRGRIAAGESVQQ
jgi:hypothetical protein